MLKYVKWVAALVLTAAIGGALAAGVGGTATAVRSSPAQQVSDRFAVIREAGGTPASAAVEERIKRVASATVSGPANRDGTRPRQRPVNNLSVRLARTRNGRGVYVGFADEAVCVATSGTTGVGSVGCGLPQDVARDERPMVGVEKTDDGWQVVGLVSDDVADITVGDDSGSSTRASISNNIALADLTERPTTLNVTLGGGKQLTLPLHAP